MEADRERVRGDGGKRCDLGGEPSEAREERDRGDAPARSSATFSPSTARQWYSPDARKSASSDCPTRLDRPRTIASMTSRRSPLRPRALSPASHRSTSVAEPVDAAAPADDAPRPLRAKDDVDSLPPQPRRLVEAVRRASRGAKLREQRDVGALRRRAAERQLEVDRLAWPERPPTEEDGSRALVEAAGLRWLVDLDDRLLDRADAGDEHAAIELGKPDASPRPAAERDRYRRGADAESRLGDDKRERPGGARGERERRHRHARRVRERAAHAHGTHDDVRQPPPQVTGSRALSAAPCAPARSRARLRARTTEWNAPCCCR